MCMRRLYMVYVLCIPPTASVSSSIINLILSTCAWVLSDIVNQNDLTCWRINTFVQP